MKISALSFVCIQHCASSKKKLKHMNMQEGTLKSPFFYYFEVVLHVSVLVALGLTNCCHFHSVKVSDKFYKFLNANSSGQNFLFLVNLKQIF